jgi:DNA-binding MarR family transcriptional regulator
MNEDTPNRPTSRTPRRGTAAAPVPAYRQPVGLPEHLLLLMMSSSRMMMMEAARAVPDLRLTPPQFRILNYVFRHPGTSLSQVAVQLGVRLPTASVMLVKLAQEELVTRDRDPASRRRMQLQLTERGEQIMAKVRANVFSRMEARLSLLDEPTRAQLEKAMPALEQPPPEPMPALEPPPPEPMPALELPPPQRGGPPVDFRLRFSQIAAFKSFFDNLGCVLQEVTLEVKNDAEGFRGLSADSLDSRGIVLVHGSLAARVEQLNVADSSFCINIQDIRDVFPNILAQNFVDLYRVKGSTDITLFVFEPGMRTTTPTVRLKTLACDKNSMDLPDMTYSYYVEMDLATFKNALKTAKSQKAHEIKLCIYEDVRVGGGGDGGSGEQLEKTIWFVVKYDGERTSMSFPFESRIMLSRPGEPMIIRAIDAASAAPAPDADVGGSDENNHDNIEERLAQLEPVYNDRFLAEFLCNFVQKMERNTVTFRMAPSKPLIVEYPLGSSSTDRLRYVLAPLAHEGP